MWLFRLRPCRKKHVPFQNAHCSLQIPLVPVWCLKKTQIMVSNALFVSNIFRGSEMVASVLKVSYSKLNHLKIFFNNFLYSGCRRKPKIRVKIQVPHNEEIEYDTDAPEWEKGRRRKHRWILNFVKLSSVFEITLSLALAGQCSL